MNNKVILIAFLQLLSFVFIGIFGYYSFQKPSPSPDYVPLSAESPSPIPRINTPSPSPTPINVNNYDEFKTYLDTALSTISAKPNSPAVLSESVRQTSYIPIDSSYSTTSTDWIDVPAGQVYIDLKNDFSESAYVTWSALLKTESGSGQAYARLYDKSNKIVVDNSEISVINSKDYQLVSSPKLDLWSGNNKYVVQIKSLNSFNISYTNGKIKVVY